MDYNSCAMDPKDFPKVFDNHEYLRQAINYWGTCWIFVDVTEQQQKRILSEGFMCKSINN